MLPSKIKEFDGYLIYPDGRVLNLKSQKFLKPYLMSTGYLAVGLRISSNKFKNVQIHSLIARCFVEGYTKGKEVNHIDANKLNNSIENLEWVTHKENVQHAKRMGLMKNNFSTSHNHIEAGRKGGRNTWLNLSPEGRKVRIKKLCEGRWPITSPKSLTDKQ